MQPPSPRPSPASGSGRRARRATKACCPAWFMPRPLREPRNVPSPLWGEGQGEGALVACSHPHPGPLPPAGAGGEPGGQRKRAARRGSCPVPCANLEMSPRPFGERARVRGHWWHAATLTPALSRQREREESQEGNESVLPGVVHAPSPARTSKCPLAPLGRGPG